MKSAVIVFPGSNCDRDMMTTLHALSGHQPQAVWHGDSELPSGLDFIAIPGGFSYGDYLRSGAIAANSPIMRELHKAADKGVYILGVCNGFQILTETKLLPGALMRNQNLHFMCKKVRLQVANDDSAFTAGYASRQTITIPIAHHDGNYAVDPDGLSELQDNGQIAFTYHSENPNGSIANIAGILSQNKRILGMMPHPERAIDNATGGIDGIPLFESIINKLS